MDNLAEQCEELEALKSIYDDNWRLEMDTNCYSIQINPNVKLFVTLNDDYPSSKPPSFELLAPTLTSEQKQLISDEFGSIYESSQGSPILFQWIEKLKEIVDECSEVLSAPQPEVLNGEVEEKQVRKETFLQVIHGDIIQDRKSVFQGHMARVHSLEETREFMDFLLDNKKIAQATHNISAYRILTSQGTILQDCDDDGETHAGGRILHLLQILNVTNVMVVVSRWYGGIQLGPDRFKHINNAARQVLVQGGVLPS
ncbi:Protein IMPACT-B-like Protein [Tribolium castaneum]|uniref:Protein IMPACT-B-like Protein n=1 Tax=Tribolium castaneum TaxID=7070 RepID=D6WDT9_TRICA|nr:PREDICTED: protein IMPACT [Tribolium castaneum]EFA00826.2 Protein IMPACT-B-like Protein [Tribolium castaneum]|eukprot:XP_008191158.1 PREDICTED: protein IMPACT [Tribolium castaneum]